jgi:hypothetical protein
MLPVSEHLSFCLKGRNRERTTMGNLASAGELAGSHELDGFSRLQASESQPEEEGDEDGEEEHGSLEPEDTPPE